MKRPLWLWTQLAEAWPPRALLASSSQQLTLLDLVVGTWTATHPRIAASRELRLRGVQQWYMAAVFRNEETRRNIFRFLGLCFRSYQQQMWDSWKDFWLAVAYRGRFGGFKPPPPTPKFRRPSEIVPNSTRLWKLLKIAEFGTPTPQDVRKKGSKILKLPPIRSCFTLAMTNKLVVIINSLKVTKI